MKTYQCIVCGFIYDEAQGLPADRIAPGTDKGDRYCARSFGDMKSEGYDCSGAERNTPLCLSRAKWKCSGKTSRRDEGLTPGKS